MAQSPHLLGSGTRHWLKIVVASSRTAPNVSLGRFFALSHTLAFTGSSVPLNRSALYTSCSLFVYYYVVKTCDPL